ncbi:MAG: phosphonopyruvate decarboxylase [Chloroflexi bacterium]|nr:phosphonopyruvate decarboxylase [Chloroflexota bacterium]
MKCEEWWDIFKSNGFTYFTGVPDSTFKSWMSFLNDSQEVTNRIAATERDAIGWASGYHVATGNIGVVYMQNSGLGNTVNPITSLSDACLYNIPMLLLIGWRGEPGKHDEPQHVKMGKVTLPLLELLGIKYSVLSKDMECARETISEAKKYMESTNNSYALIIKEGVLEAYQQQHTPPNNYAMKREEAIKVIVAALDQNDLIVSTTGKTSRELFEYRESKRCGHGNDFLMVGSMGLAHVFGAEVALQRPQRRVFIFDGDGALIMGAGALSTIGYYAPTNFCHIVFDNEAHESTGGQPTTSSATDFVNLALANNYTWAKKVTTKADLDEALITIRNMKGPSMLIVKIAKGSRENLGRPTTGPIENKHSFMTNLAQDV